ncbi:cytochrome P450 [Hypoxylon trugodes]|uniref:cytochrome P450 n=1 Tax=Hypoxylon trugodes TaxID=326681 RepID=UPI0021A1FB88|nr:cytochrome P450 [Hypoxylon trugodes]KAI1383010.1 cytochrome P450 [Hypoxylon trugodes]
MKSLKDGLPKDAHDVYSHQKLTTNWRKYFPSEKEKCPPVIYLDLWPFVSEPFIMATSPEACFQLTQQTPQPRHPGFSWATFPVTGGKDLISMDPPNHRIWRSRLNPGFSMQNLLSHAPIIIEEVSLFTKLLKEQAGKDGTYGELFGLFDKTVALTFDVITRVSLDLRLREQTEGPTPFLNAYRKLITYMKTENIRTRIERWKSSYRQDVALNSKVISDTLLPLIQSSLKPDASSRKTIIDLAVKEFKKEHADKSVQPSKEFIDTIVSMLKLFILAGHETTAQAICWSLYEVHRNPGVLKKLREEHDQILGSNPKLAAEEISKQPGKLNSLRYTTAIIKETLRLHPLGSTLRQGSRGFNIVYEGTVYPTEGSTVYTSPTAIHYRADLFPRPTEFLPERFLVPEGHSLYPVKNAWRAFELGSTRCIGEELALMELKLALVFTVREMEFEFDGVGWHDLQGRTTPVDAIGGERIYRTGNGVGRPKDGMPTRVRLR